MPLHHGEAAGDASVDVTVEQSIRAESDVVLARRLVREAARGLEFDLVTQTKLVTATSELGRNVLVHGGGGTMSMTTYADEVPPGIELVFQDSGPGIADLERAMSGGCSTGNGLGLGLSGSRRLVHEFDIESDPSSGTRVRILMWRRR